MATSKTLVRPIHKVKSVIIIKITTVTAKVIRAQIQKEKVSNIAIYKLAYLNLYHQSL